MEKEIQTIDITKLLNKSGQQIPKLQLECYLHLIGVEKMIYLHGEAIISVIEEIEDFDNITEAEYRLMSDRAIERWRDCCKELMRNHKHMNN